MPFGVIDTGADGRSVTGVREKPALSLDVSAGVYAVSAQTLDLVPAGAPCTMPELIQTVPRW